MDLQDWLAQTPTAFPDYFNTTTPFQNPLIKESQQDTLMAARDVTQFLIEGALPWPGNESFSLSKKSTWGFIHVLECLTGALDFELTFRPDGGECSDSENEETDDGEAESPEQ